VHTLRSISGILLTCAVAAGAVACSSNSSAPPAPSAPAATSAGASSAPGASGAGSNAATEQAIAANWIAFFDAKTPVAKRVQLLQDGPEFQALIQAQSGSSIASEASATVTKVTLTSSIQARVSFTVLLAGAPALPNQYGTAVYEDGVWKVGAQSFCNLMALEGSTSELPPVCASTSAG
jgi:hypothetical protein